MCGASSQQEEISQEQADFYKQMETQDATTFGEDQAILQQVQSAYAPILAKGPNQDGFSDAETNDLNSSATDGVATDYAAASKSLRENQAAEGGGDSYLSSGVSAQQNAGLAENAAEQESSDKLQIKQAGYTQGYDEFKQATSALEGAEGLNNSVEYAGATNTAGSDASSTATAVNDANNSWYAPLMGAIGGVGAAATAKFVH